jgi:hypothetical protein
MSFQFIRRYIVQLFRGLDTTTQRQLLQELQTTTEDKITQESRFFDCFGRLKDIDFEEDWAKYRSYRNRTVEL